MRWGVGAHRSVPCGLLVGSACLQISIVGLAMHEGQKGTTFALLPGWLAICEDNSRYGLQTLEIGQSNTLGHLPGVGWGLGRPRAPGEGLCSPQL